MRFFELLKSKIKKILGKYFYKEKIESIPVF